MSGNRTPEQPSDDFSLSHISNQDDVIASMRARRELSQQEQAQHEEASLADLSLDERARQQQFRTTMRDMIGEKEANRPIAGSRNYNRYSERSGRDIYRGSVVPSVVVLSTLAVAGFFGPGIITDANYGEQKASQYLEESGYTDIQLTSKSQILVGWQGCDGNDSAKYSFEATALNGTDATVIVCKGMFKGATIRD